MMTFTTSTHRPGRPTVGDAQNPAVVNVRRPHLAPAEVLPDRPSAVPSGLDDAPPPQTVLRLPDLAAVVKSLPAMRGKLKLAAIAQWAAIGLGGLLALWLIFGGHASTPAIEEEAPAWSAPASATADSPPGWNGPGSSRADATPPARAESVPMPAHEGNHGAPAEHEFDPYHQMQPGGEPGSAAGPDWDESAAGSGASPATRPPVLTAQRSDAAGNSSADRFQPSEAEPLNVTVPVPQ
jgi:hypothetical protein